MNHSSFFLSLDELGVERPPAEVHGLLCGLMCTSGVEKAKTLWFGSVLQEYSAKPEKLRENGESLKSLDAFFYDAVNQLNDAELGFTLVIDEDLASPHEHLLQLASWCNGFGLGFGMGERATAAIKLPEDTQELLADFQAIADYESVQQSSSSETDVANEGDDGNEEESDVVEIEEFVRVGVLLINEEMQPAVKPVSGQKPDPDALQGFEGIAGPGTDKRTLH